MSPRSKRLALWLPSYILFGAGIGIVSDSLQDDIRTTGDAVYAAVRFPVLALVTLGGLGGTLILARAGILTKHSGPPRRSEADR